MKPIVIVCNPDFEAATHAFEVAWRNFHADKMKKLVEECGGKLIELHGSDDVWSKLKPVLDSLKEDEIVIIIGVGHGNDNVYTGYNYTLLFGCGPYDGTTDKYAPKVCVFAPISCLVGKELVPHLVKKGTHWGIGELTPYYIIVGSQNGEPENAFVGSDLALTYEILNALKNGREIKAQEAWDVLQKAYKQAIDYWSTRNGSVAYYLKKDLENREMWEDGFVIKPSEPQPHQYTVIVNVEDTDTKQPVKYADVTVWNKTHTPITNNTATQGCCYFLLDEGSYDIRIEKEGYITLQINDAITVPTQTEYHFKITKKPTTPQPKEGVIELEITIDSFEPSLIPIPHWITKFLKFMGYLDLRKLKMKGKAKGKVEMVCKKSQQKAE